MAQKLDGELEAKMKTIEMILNRIRNGEKQSSDDLRVFRDAVNGFEVIEEFSFRGISRNGREWKNYILQQLIICDNWNKSNVGCILSVIEQFSFSKEDYQKIVGAFFYVVSTFTVDDVDEYHFAQQLKHLIAAINDKSLKMLIFWKVIEFYRRREERINIVEQDSPSLSNFKEIRQQKSKLRKSEAEVIAHITYESTWSKELAKEHIKNFKTCCSLPHLILNPFCIAFGLSVCEQHNLEEQITLNLKNAIKHCLLEAHRVEEGSSWLKSQIPNCKTDIDEIILEIVYISLNGISLHIEIMKLAFRLIDSLPGFSKAIDLFDKPKQFLSVNEETCLIGAKLLIKLFETHSTVRETIVMELFQRISERSSGSFFVNIAILKQMIQQSPSTMLKCKERMKEIIEWIPHCSHLGAIELTKALMPLLKICMSLKNTLVTVFRNTLLHRNIEVQKVSVTGFLIALKFFKLSGSMPWSQSQTQSVLSILNNSQLSLTQKIDPNAYEALCVELFRILNKCLTLSQFEIRQVFYEGIISVVKTNPKLIGMVCEILLRQFERAFNNDLSKMSLIKTEQCLIANSAEEPVLIEPFAYLLKAIARCVYFREKYISTESEIEQFENIRFYDRIQKLNEKFVLFVQTIANVRLAELGFDKSVNFKDKNFIKRKIAWQMIASFEVCIEFYFMRKEKDEQNWNELLMIYKKIQSLSEMITEPAKKTIQKGKKMKKDPKATESQSSTTNTEQTIEYTLGDSIPNITMSTSTQMSITSACQTICKQEQNRYCQIINSLVFFETFFKDVFNQESNSEVIKHFENDSLPFILMVLFALKQKIQEFNRNGKFDGFTGDDIKHIFPILCSISRSLFVKINHTSLDKPSQSVSSTQDNRTNTLIMECTDTLRYLFIGIHYKYPYILRKFAHYTCSQSNCELDEESIYALNDEDYQWCIWSIEKLIERAYKTAEFLSCVPHYFEIFSILCSNQHLRDEETIRETYKWLTEFAKSKPIESIEIVKPLLNLCVKLSIKQQKQYINLLKNLSLDSHKCLGDIDESFTVQHEKQFAVVNNKTIPIVCLIILTHTESLIDETELVFNRMRTLLIVKNNKNVNFTNEDRIAYEVKICKRLNHILDILLELCQTNLPSGASMTETLNLVTKLFDFLTNLTRHFHSLYLGKLIAKSDASIPDAFINLIKRCGKLMSGKITAFFDYCDNTPKNKKRKGEGAKRVILGKSKQVAAVIFAYENYQRFLTVLQKKAEVELTKYYKDQARDIQWSKSIIAEMRKENPETIDD